MKVLLWYGEHSCHLFPVESALYLLAHVLQGLGQPGHSVDGSFSRALLSKVDLHVVLLANPDGRNHLEQTGNHCWCGTSIGTSLSAVFHSGMDLNRAEPECQVLLNLTRTQTFDSFVSFHSGARAIYVASSGMVLCFGMLRKNEMVLECCGFFLVSSIFICRTQNRQCSAVQLM